MGLRGKSLVAAITATCCVGQMLFGYDQGVMSGLVGVDDNAWGRTFDAPGPDITGIISAIYTIGCFFGSVLVFFIGESLGRRRVIMVGSVIMLIGTALQASSYSRAQMIVGRVVTGFGVGSMTSIVAAWQSETAPEHIRGRLVSIEGFLIITGVCIAYWLDYGFAQLSDTNQAQWRFPIAFQAVFGIFLLCVIPFLPESPRWLCARGRYDEARDVIAALDGRNTSVDDPAVIRLYNEIIHALELENEGGPFRYAELFHGGQMQNFRRMSLCFGVLCFQQMSGICLITYYAPVIFEKSIGMSRELSLLLGGFNALEYWVASFIPIIIIERVGRRKLMLFGAAGQMSCMVVLAITVHNGGKAAGYVAATCLFLFNTFFALGWLAIPWLYPAEISTLRIRSRGTAVASASNWIFNFIVVMITPIAITNIGYKTYIIFAIINACFIPTVYFFFPETAGKTLEEIDTIFDHPGIGRGAWNASSNVLRRRRAVDSEISSPPSEKIDEVKTSAVENVIKKDDI